MKRLMTLLCVALALLRTPFAAQAQVTPVPNTMNFQGRLAKPDGTPVADGTYPIRFSLWDNVATPPGVEKWNQAIINVTVRNGAFAVTLNAFPANVFNSNLFLEIKVGADAPLTPRQPLSSVAYAFKAGSVSDGAITGASLAAGTVTLDKLAASVQTTLSHADYAYFSLIGSAVTGTGPTDLAFDGVYLYVVASNILQIFDVSNTNEPILVGSVITGSGPVAIAVVGNFAYVVNINGNTLQIVDVTTKTAPVVVGTVATTTRPTSVAVAGNFAYVTTEGGDNLQIFNVATKTAPVLASGVGVGTNPSSVAVNGVFAYVLNKDSASFTVVNVANPNGPSVVTTVATGISPRKIIADNGRAYVANEGSNTVSIYNILTPSAPALLSTFSTGALPFSLADFGTSTLYVGSLGADVVAAYNVANPATPQFLGSISLEGHPSALALGGNALFTCGQSSTGFINVLDANSVSLQTPDLNARGILSVRDGLIGTAGNIKTFGNLMVDAGGTNLGAPNNALLFGGAAAEGIGSDRDGTVNVNGLDFYTKGLNRVAITNAGRVGIGVTAPAFLLELPNNAADSTGRGRANAWVTYSSGRWKHNVAPIEDPLTKVLNLNGVMFDWNAENGGGHDIGFVAEDAGRIIPELVTWEPDASGFASGMKYDRVSALLVEAVKTQQKQIEAQKKEIDALKARVKRQDALEARLKTLEDTLNLHAVSLKSKAGAKK